MVTVLGGVRGTPLASASSRRSSVNRRPARAAGVTTTTSLRSNPSGPAYSSAMIFAALGRAGPSHPKKMVWMDVAGVAPFIRERFLAEGLVPRLRAWSLG